MAVMLQSGMTASIDPARAQNYRLCFLLAALYNGAFGVRAGLFPNAFFDVFQVPRIDYPSVWQVLAMVLGLYGLGYAYAALRLDRATPFIAIGLLGKVIGPIGWVFTVLVTQELPVRTLPLIIFNDIVWWLPFGLFLLEGRALGARLRGLAPYACGVLNLTAAGALALVLRPGTEVGGDEAARVKFISEHPVLWRRGWALWVAAALSLAGFLAWWGSRVSNRRLASAALLVACAGIAFDLTAEALYIGWLPSDLAAITPAAALLTGGLGNGLYTVAGTLLTLGTRGIGGWFAAWTWTMWAAGYGLSAATLLHSFAGAAVCTAVLFALFCPWCVVMGRRLA
ncbi:MAG: hypothetical protein M3O87_08565 [Candidatus Dormibacteraeota bacterium]|nr:hypothetical protein [Candidatus Dormibacteraeota bacterium]